MFLLNNLLISRGFFYMKKWFNIDIALAFFFPQK
ncbi:tryptophanase leader peptide [Providencia stuartii]|uniref:Tryptophanase leader peptide n=2 Tax=Providencia TaxID=586 RepID=A0AAI9DCX9_PROST|nr:tryptophanase leader peptide [Providencia stuartii]QQO61868.1 tryptophanase leader peptide [Providencia manganoxydans]ELR5081230.1 tryptophanase leader peptide [Providencia stuartii]ELR5113465.1 tryptophanase leader peptide [Providencia stuartii]ELR5300122.1 tryptophanase leader peptide [Providencia stuartii]